MEENTRPDYRKKYIKYKTKYIKIQRGAGIQVPIDINCSL